MKKLLRVLKGTPFTELRPVQEEALAVAIGSDGDILEIPTGHGKSLVGVLTSLTNAKDGYMPYYVTPVKSQVDQIGQAFPAHTSVAFGRSEYDCLYYEGKSETPVTAQESPCYMLKCPHRVNQQTGETAEPGAVPCPYYQAKYDAKVGQEQGKITVCTTAFFLTNRLLARKSEDEEEQPISAVLDEGHNLAKIARGVYEYTVTDYHLKRAYEALMAFDKKQATIVKNFRTLFMRIAREKKKPAKRSLLSSNDLVRLLDMLEQFDEGRVEKAVRSAIEKGKLDEVDDRQEIKLLENLVRNIPALIRSLNYSLPEEKPDGSVRHPLNYVVAFYYQKDDPTVEDPRHKARYYLTVKAYYVAPLIRRALGADARTTVLSATIGNAGIFGHETGLRMPFTAFTSSFDAANTRIFMPTDTPNLSHKYARRNDPKHARKVVLEAAARFSKKGIRSLIVTVSNDERESYFKDAFGNYGLDPLTYGQGIHAREAASQFRDGYGDCLIGTASQFSEGLDLPDGTCPVIFFVRPGYPQPDDPLSQFELQRFTSSHCWSLWQYRVMIQALQVRGRNIRSAEDLGVCFFISQQFRQFLYGSLPEWLKPSYVGDKPMEKMVKETLKLLDVKRHRSA